MANMLVSQWIETVKEYVNYSSMAGDILEKGVRDNIYKIWLVLN